ncbi:HNH endonuclease, partial [Nonomuraea angiospora]
MSTKDAIALLAGAIIAVSFVGGAKTSPATAASPLGNTSGTRPGLAPIVSAADKGRARGLIKRVRVKGLGPNTGYERIRYGGNWAD